MIIQNISCIRQLALEVLSPDEVFGRAGMDMPTEYDVINSLVQRIKYLEGIFNVLE